MGVTLCWGLVPVMLRWLRHHVDDGFTTNLIRYPAATLLFLPLMVIVVRRKGMTRIWLTALIPASVNIIGQTLWAWAPYYLQSNTMAFVGPTATVWGILAAFLMFPDERRLAGSPWFWSGTLCFACGFLLIFTGGETSSDGNTLTGYVILLACGMCWGLYGVFVRYVIHDHHPLYMFGIISAYTSIGAVFMAPLGRTTALLEMTGGPWAILLLSSLLGIAVAHSLYYTAIQRIGAAVSTLAFMTSPMITIVASAMVLRESLSLGQWIGGGILIAGASLAVWSRHRTFGGRPQPIETGSESASPPPPQRPVA